MDARCISRWRQGLARRLAALWHEAPPRLRPANTFLDVELKPSPLVRRLAWLLPALALLYAAELLLTRHWLTAAAVVALAALGWAARGPPGATPRRLVVDPDGGLWLECDGALREARLDPASCRLGRRLLLVLRQENARHRLLLGPDNVAPGALAALCRRLAAGPAGTGSALHSFAAPGSQSSDPP